MIYAADLTRLAKIFRWNFTIRLTLSSAIARHRRGGDGSYRATCMTVASLKLPPFRPHLSLPLPPCQSGESTLSFTPKMAAQFLEAVRNRRVNIGRSISVFGRGGKRRWHATSNTGVMQRHTQLQKSRATHPRALRPLRRAPFSSSFPSVHRQP